MRNGWKTWVSRIGLSVGVVVLSSTAVLAGEGEGKGKGKPMGGPRADRAATTQPAGGKFGGGNRKDDFLQDTLAKLNLTAEQKVRVDSLVESHKGLVKKWHEEHKAEVQKASEELKAARESGDEAKLREARKNMFETMSTAPRPKDLADQIRAVLTPDQQKQFDEAIAKKREQFEQNHPGMGTRPGGGKGERHGKGGDKAPNSGGAPGAAPKDGGKLNL